VVIALSVIIFAFNCKDRAVMLLCGSPCIMLLLIIVVMPPPHRVGYYAVTAIVCLSVLCLTLRQEQKGIAS